MQRSPTDCEYAARAPAVRAERGRWPLLARRYRCGPPPPGRRGSRLGAQALDIVVITVAVRARHVADVDADVPVDAVGRRLVPRGEAARVDRAAGQIDVDLEPVLEGGRVV